jgi:hypothetical protein
MITRVPRAFVASHESTATARSARRLLRRRRVQLARGANTATHVG